MKKIFVFFSMCFVCCLSRADLAGDMKTSQELINSGKYAEAVEKLQSIQSERDKVAGYNWYYLMGVASAKLGNVKDAENYLNTYISGAGVNNAARAYYFLGEAQISAGEYDKAVTSYELSTDLSKDSALDRVVESKIEQALKTREFYENRKSLFINLLAGYAYSTDALKINGSLVSDTVNGHVLNYGAFFEYRALNNVDQSLGVNFSAVDTYSLDGKFKATSSIQSNDMLQFSAGIPWAFTTGASTAHDLSINYYNSYLPDTNGNRQVFQRSYFLKYRSRWALSNPISVAAVASSDSEPNSVGDNDGTGSRADLSGELIHYLSRDRLQAMQYVLSGSMKSAKGAAVRYNKIQIDTAYIFPTPLESSSSLKAAVTSLSYPDKSTPRTDLKIELSYGVAKVFSAEHVLNLNVGYTQNNSNEDLYKYSDASVGLLYTKSFSY